MEQSIASWPSSCGSVLRVVVMTAAFAMLPKCKVFALAISLGGIESLIEHPSSMTHAGIPQSIRHEIGIEDGLIRLSVGIEHINDLIADLAQALG